MTELKDFLSGFFFMQAEQRERLTKLVATINDNVRNFYKIGLALKEIQDKRLYRDNYDTFDEFFKNYLNIDRSYAYRQIAASEVINNLSPNGDVPLNESQVRPLTGLKPSEQQLAWQHAIDVAETSGRKVTSLDVKRAISIVTGKDSFTSKKSKTENIDVVSKDFKKVYDIFLNEIMKAMNSNWESTSKRIIIHRLKTLIKFLKSHK